MKITCISQINTPSPYAIGRNGTGYIIGSSIRRRKDGSYSAIITATGKLGQPLWSERRTFTAGQLFRGSSMVAAAQETPTKPSNVSVLRIESNVYETR